MVLPLYLQDLGAGILEVGFCYALIMVTWYGFQLPGGLLSDRIGRKSLTVVSALASVLCYGVLS
jgi:MFS family permease